MKLCVYCSIVVTHYDSRYRCRNCHRWLDRSEVLDLDRIEAKQDVEMRSNNEMKTNPKTGRDYGSFS